MEIRDSVPRPWLSRLMFSWNRALSWYASANSSTRPDLSACTRQPARLVAASGCAQQYSDKTVPGSLLCYQIPGHGYLS